jgi:hypothetical protein
MPQRATASRGLRERLAYELPGVEQVVRVGGGPDFRKDFPTILEMAASRGQRWVVTLEDDAYPAVGFGAALRSGIEEAEKRGAAISFFSRSNRDLEMMDRGERWRVQPGRSFTYNLCVALPSEVILGLLEYSFGFYARRPEMPATARWADTLLGEYLDFKKVPILVQAPSIVQHLGIPSTLGHAGVRQSESYRRAFGETKSIMSPDLPRVAL